MPDDVRFLLHLTGVMAVRALTIVPWPGPRPETVGKSYEEQCRLVNEYQSRAREESISWPQFEASVAEMSFDVYDADCAASHGRVTLHIQGTLDDEHWYELFLEAEQLSALRNDGIEFSLDQFQALGEAYWENFARR